MATNNNSKNLMIEHLVRDSINVEKLRLTPVEKEYTTGHKKTVALIKAFVSDVVEITNESNDCVSFETFFKRYVSYCKAHKTMALSMRRLNKLLRNPHGFVDGKGRDVNTGKYSRCWIGIRLGLS